MAAELFDDLPAWLDADLWRDFIANRKGIKKPMTEVGQKRMLMKLLRWHERGIDVNECLERSLINGWKDIYEPDARRPKSTRVEDLFAGGFRLELDDKGPKPGG